MNCGRQGGIEATQQLPLQIWSLGYQPWFPLGQGFTGIQLSCRSGCQDISSFSPLDKCLLVYTIQLPCRSSCQDTTLVPPWTRVYRYSTLLQISCQDINPCSPFDNLGLPVYSSLVDLVTRMPNNLVNLLLFFYFIFSNEFLCLFELICKD